MFFTDFENNLFAAVTDFYLDYADHGYIEFPDLKPYLNSGVLLINNKKWKEQNIKELLLEKTNLLSNVFYGDQDIFNIIFKGKWKKLNKIYNYQTGARFAFYEKNLDEQAQEAEKLAEGEQPIIIHYTSQYKPWLYHPHKVLYAEKYWFYYQLSWEEILKQHNK